MLFACFLERRAIGLLGYGIRIPRLADGLDVQLHKRDEETHDTRKEGVQSQALHALAAAFHVPGH